MRNLERAANDGHDTRSHQTNKALARAERAAFEQRVGDRSMRSSDRERRPVLEGHQPPPSDASTERRQENGRACRSGTSAGLEFIKTRR
jgi:hypothetical protein